MRDRAAHRSWQLLRDPVLRRLWLAGVAINVVRWLEILAFSLYALEITGSPFLVALTLFARMAPLLLSAYLAALTDRVDRRLLLRLLLMGLVAVDTALFLAWSAGALGIAALLAAAFLAGLAWTLENPLRRTMLAEAAGMDRVHASMGLETASNQLNRALGPAIGGIMIETLGIGGVLLTGAVVHVAGYVAIRALPLELAGRGAKAAGAGWSALVESVRFVACHRLLQATLLITLIFNLWAFPYVGLAPVIAERVLGLSPTGIGLLLATEALGGVSAALLIMVFARQRWFVPLYGWGAALFTVGTFALGVLETAWIAFAVLYIAGFGIGAFNGMQSIIPILATPAELRVRVMGLVTVCIGAAPLGFLYSGALAESFGAATAQLLIGAHGLVALALVAWRYPEIMRPLDPTAGAPRRDRDVLTADP